ncbi:MAG: flavin reductase domain protein FMN-binding protein [Gemmatimonadetes bacterium]|nr:flavin reductase domain protein FMN-binding protein [Gemmatimonadota bacterium]
MIPSEYLAGSVTEGPVALVLCEHAGRRNAMTVSFFSEVSHYPASVWISIAHTRLTHAMLLESKRFSLVVLHERQAAFARMCGEVSGRTEDKCARLPISVKDGWLFVDGALASMGCEITQSRDLGDHTLFIASILVGETETRNTMRRHLLTTDLAPT